MKIYIKQNYDILKKKDDICKMVECIKSNEYDEFMSIANDIDFDELLIEFNNLNILNTNILDIIKDIIYILKVSYSNGNTLALDKIYDRSMIKFKKLGGIEPIVEHLQDGAKRCSVEHDYPRLKGTLLKSNKLYTKDKVDDLDCSLEERLRKYFSICKQHNEKLKLEITKKFDGSSIILSINSKGKITKAISRGDENGKGIDISNLFKHIRYNNTNKIGLKTECIMTRENLDEYSRLRKYDYKNLRIGPVSILTSLDAEEYSKYLTLVPLRCSNDNIDNIKMNMLFDNGVSNNADIVESDDFDEVMELCGHYIDKILKTRNDLNYAIDGVVFHCMNKCVQNTLGRKNDINDFEVAYKFPPEIRYTECVGFDFTVGRTGLITPMIYYNEIEFFGGTHNKSTLSSYDRFKKLNLHIGDILKVTYNNDVMPYVTKYEDKGGKKIEYPKHCKCDDEINLVLKGSNYYCVNPNCCFQNITKITHFLKKLGIKEISEKTIEKLIDNNIIHNIIDLFNIDYNELYSIEGFGDISIQHLKNSINNIIVQEIDEAKFVSSLSICGERIARMILSHVPLLVILDNKQELYDSDIFRISYKTKDKFISNIETNIDIILKLYKLLNIKYVKNKSSKMKVVFTGFRDNKIEALLDTLGIEVSSSVSKNISYVITKDVNIDQSSKIIKAKKLNLPIITLKEFSKILKEDFDIDTNIKS